MRLVAGPEELASGVDALYLSGHASLSDELLAGLEAHRSRVQSGENVDVEFGGGRWAVLGRSFGRYRFCLSNEFGQLGLTPSGNLPALRFQPRAEFLHGLGPGGVVEWIDDVARSEVGEVQWSVSRVDLFADWQGWALSGDQRHRFLCRATSRATYEESEALTGFVFGHRRTGTFSARLYDKTKDVERKGSDYWFELWGAARRDEEQVVRVEFEVGREGMRQFDLREPNEVLAAVGSLWAYATEEWLTYRSPTSDQTKARWPIAAEWRAVQGASLRGTAGGLDRVYEGKRRGSLRRLAPAVTGYLASFGALSGCQTMDETVAALPAYLRDYEIRSGRSFASRIEERRAEGAA